MSDSTIVWKDFDRNEVSHSVAHYLMAIEELSGLKGCKAADIARHLDVSRNAVSLKVKALVDQELVAVDEFHSIILTDKGSKIVHHIVSSRKLFKEFLMKILLVDEMNAEKDSCKVEHLISQSSISKIAQMLQFFDKDSDMQTAITNYQDFQKQEEKNCNVPCKFCTGGSCYAGINN